MAQANDGNQPAQQNNGIGVWLNRLFIMACLYVLLFGNPFKTSLNPSSTAPTQPSQVSLVKPTQSIITPIAKNGHHYPVIIPGTRLDFYVAVSESDDPSEIELSYREPHDEFQWFIDDIIFDDWSDASYRQKSMSFPTPVSLQNNGTMFAHVFVVSHGANPSVVRKSEPSRKNFYIHAVHPLTKYMTLNTGVAKKNLLKSNSGEAEIPAPPKTILSHWKGNYSLTLITDYSAFPQGAIPPQVLPFFKFDEEGNYYPIVWSNDFWILKEDFMPLNDTVKQLNLDLKFEPMSLLKFSIFAQLGQSFSMQQDMFGGAQEGDSDQFKRMLIDNPPWLLALTFTISIIHTVLDLLAFKNEIEFWKNRKSMKGLSLKTIYINIISNIIILLYLLDNDTNWLILFSAGSSTLIEAWKITKAATVKIVYGKQTRFFKLPVWLEITELQSYKSTKSHDDEAMKYLIYLIYPLVFGYAIYSLTYEDHKSWCSFVVGTLAGSVYTFGFIMMTPQLFINYRLKSVAHLPWRTFVYKGINTFIDDLFAFIIRMPTMHRLRCFRDDLIFVIYLYQRWIYPVDASRVEVLDGELGESADAQEIEAERVKQEQEKLESSETKPENSEQEKKLKVD